MAPLDLLYLINGLGPGGAERSLVELLPHFQLAGIRTTVVCLRDRRHNAEAVGTAGAELHFLSSRGLFGWVREVRDLIRRRRPALLHTTIFEADLVGRLAALGSGVPVLTSLVNTAYDPIRLQDPNVRRLTFFATREVDALTGRMMTDQFHALTEAVKRSSVDTMRIPADRIAVIPRGRSVERLGDATPERRAAARERMGVPADASVILNVGRQEFQKAQGTLLDAMAELPVRHLRAHLVIVGREGYATAALKEKVAEYGLHERVSFLGFRNDVPDLLAGADVFAFPSLYEGQGGAVLEAMALGLPVVASDIGPLREVVAEGETGYLVPTGNASALADRISMLLDDRALCARLGARGRDRFRENFTIERSASRMVELYRRVAR